MKFKRKKVRRYRASTFHGWGRGAAHHKGAGNRGGRGRSGSGKKADQKKPSYWQDPVGKNGFASKNRMKIKAINASDINLSEWITRGFATSKGDSYEIDLRKAGYNKLLGSGKVTVKMIVSTDFASKGAIEKVKSAGGSVNVLKHVEKKKKQKKQPDKKQEEE